MPRLVTRFLFLQPAEHALVPKKLKFGIKDLSLARNPLEFPTIKDLCGFYLQRWAWHASFQYVNFCFSINLGCLGIRMGSPLPTIQPNVHQFHDCKSCLTTTVSKFRFFPHFLDFSRVILADSRKNLHFVSTLPRPNSCCLSMYTTSLFLALHLISLSPVNTPRTDHPQKFSFTRSRVAQASPCNTFLYLTYVGLQHRYIQNHFLKCNLDLVTSVFDNDMGLT